MRFIQNRLFWKFFISITLTMLVTVFISLQFEHWVRIHQSQKRIEDTVDHLIDTREELYVLLSNEALEDAAELLLNSPDDRKQFLIFDSYGNEILGRKKVASNAFRSRFARELSSEFRARNLSLNSEVISVLGNTYEIVIAPKMFFQPLFSPRLAGTLVRTGMLLFFALLVSYFLTHALTKRIRRLRLATQKMSAGQYTEAFPNAIKFKQDELGQLGKDFQQMAEKLHDSTEARKQILSDISHELRSPLARLQVATEIAKDKTIQQQDNSKQLDRIELESTRMKHLIAQILHIQQLQMSNSNDHNKTDDIPLEPLLQKIITDVQFEYQNTDKHINLQSKNTPIKLSGNSELLHSALENIIRNAMSHTRENSTVTIELNKDKYEVRIIVTDRGEGIAEKDRHKIFHPFTRLDNSRNRKTGGYGLGLSIAQAVIRNHGGDIIADNRHDNLSGLRMTVKLPYQTKK